MPGRGYALTSLTFAFVLMAAAASAACSAIQPEVGERLSVCIDADSNPAVKVSFKDQIRPIINGKVPGPKPCANCHFQSGGSREGVNATGLELETLGALEKGGSRTRDNIVVPGQPCKSAILQKLRGTFDGARMPRGGPYWTSDQVQLMSDWIFEGAVGDDND